MTASTRRATATAVLIALSAGSVAAVRKAQKPYVPDAPPYRIAGPAGAAVTIAEFSDFQCPGCGIVYGSVDQLLKMHPGSVRFIYKHHPWSFHPHAMEAALSAECAGIQGKFWPMHDRLFEHQMDWSQNPRAAEIFAGYARELHLDMARYGECLKDPNTAALITHDLNEADERWVNSTPTFFVNGRRIVGPRQWLGAGVREVERLAAAAER